MLKTIRRTTPLLLLALAPIGLSAQQAAPQIPEEARELVTELQQIQAQLQPVQQQALQDAELQAEQQALGQKIQEVMLASNPAVQSGLERLQALQQEAQEAHAAEDQEKLGALVTEAQTIEAQLQQSQAAALESPEVAAEVESFEAKVQAKMVEIDPDAASLIARYRELESELRTIVRG